MSNFFAESSSAELRLGDVLNGFVAITPSLSRPSTVGNTNSDFTIEVNHPNYVVVLTPCCSIKKNPLISLASLQMVPNGMFNNDNWSDDLTRINRPMEPWKIFPSAIWTEKSDTEKQIYLAKPTSYTYSGNFIYAPHDLLMRYQPSSKSSFSTNYYMISFGSTYSVKCDALKDINKNQITKILELTASARTDLRNKLVHYFGRVPEEDACSLAIAN